MSDNNQFRTEFLRVSHHLMIETTWPRMKTCVEPLSDEQVWWRPNAASNSIGNLLLHLNGNVRQWLVSSFKQVDDGRNRPAEFSERQVIPRSKLLERLGSTLKEASDVLAGLTDADLFKTFEVQGYTTTGLEAVYHVVEHFSLHYGQIAYITKQLTGEDLGFYRELDKTGRLPNK